MGRRELLAVLAECLSGRPLLTRADMARHFGITLRTVDRRIAAGQFPAPVRIVGGPRWTADQISIHEAKANRAKKTHFNKASGSAAAAA